MTAPALGVADLLKAAQCPGESRVYFIGPFTPRITFYSQQVRALQLARALDSLNQIERKERVAVVGAGAAGTTMAVALALLGHNVTLYESAEDVLHLQSGSQRLLHPHLYEWPALGSLENRAGLPLLDWTAGTGDSVCKALRLEFTRLRTGLPTLDFRPSHRLTGLAKQGLEWELKLENQSVSDKRHFDHVVLSMGFGDEIPCGSIAPEDYWKPAAIGTAATESDAGVRYVVSGNGDGALTVTLGLLVKNFEHDAFTREFLEYFTRDQLKTAAEAAFAGAAFGSDVEGSLKSHVLPVLQTYGVLDRLQHRLRKDRLVTVNAHGPLFAAGKASQLNQCMVLAVLAAVERESIVLGRTTGLVSGCEKTANGIVLKGTLLNKGPDPTAYKHAIFRHGPDVVTRYKPAHALIDRYKVHVQSILASSPAFGEPPALDDQTLDLFEDKKITLFPVTEQPKQQALLESSRQVIEITIDPASQILVERGYYRVSWIADQCERLPIRHTLDLHIAPDKLPDAADLVRLARCSKNKIELRVGAAVAGAWKKVHEGFATAPPASSMRLLTQYSPGAIAACVDAALIRFLDESVKGVVTTGAAPPLGTISPEIRTHVDSTWSSWRATLDGDATLRFDFLRWLSNVDQQVKRPWDGEHAALQRMANALVMIAAAHSGEPLTPRSIAGGNLEFAAAAVALGTGCEAIGSEPLSTRSAPEDWGVDALILSAATDVLVEDPSGTVIDAGAPATTIKNARRVRPAIIQNDRKWRSRLAGSLKDWQDAVTKEFAGWRQRQDDELTRVSG